MNYINKLDSTKRTLYYFGVSKSIALKNLLLAKKDNQYLFILSPPFCGSTLLTEIISSSKNISCNNNIGLREGQHLPIAKEILFNKDRWNPNKDIDWKRVKNIWHKYWDRSKDILLEKSPPNICRAQNIDKAFKNTRYICLVRDPYAQIQSDIRRYNTDTALATKKYISYLKYQKQNIESLKQVLLISYEELSDSPTFTKQKISNFLPLLSDINMDLEFRAHNIHDKKKMAITNLNKDKIASLTKDQIDIINTILLKEKDLINYFHYSLL